MEQEADPRGAAKGALSIAAIILSIVAICAVVVDIMVFKKCDCAKTNCGAEISEPTTDEISLEEARERFEEVNINTAGFSNVAALLKIVFPDSTITEEYPDEITPGPRYTTDIPMSRLEEQTAKYVDSKVFSYKYKTREYDYGIYDCNGFVCYQHLQAVAATDSTETITMFKKTSKNSFKAETKICYGGDENDCISQKYTISFAPNGEGGFRVIEYANVTYE